MGHYPKIEYLEQVMRDGMQIEDANIPVEAKVRLLDALGETGLKYIMVGLFVSGHWVPQMAGMDELMKRFRPKPGVKYTAMVLSEPGLQRALRYSPPLTIVAEVPTLQCHVCDVFPRRYLQKSQEQVMAGWPRVVARARELGADEAGISLHAPWGSNWLGAFTLADQLPLLEKQHRLWDEAGIKVTQIRLVDPMSWGSPASVEETMLAVKERWPKIRYFDLHLHNARGLALANVYAAIRVLGPDDTVLVEGSLGGLGGCPYCGNGRAAGLVPTEDLMDMLAALGIETGVDMDRLVDCVWLLEEMIGRRSFGHVGNAGPRPVSRDKWYPMDMPFVETLEQAKHFRLGPEVYEGCLNPWKEPIRSAKRPS